MAKILRKSLEYHKAQFPTLNIFYCKNRYFVIIAFKMLNMEFKSEYAR